MKKILCLLFSAGVLIACSSVSNQEDENKENQQTETTNKPSRNDLFFMYEITAGVNGGLQPSGNANLYISDKAIRSEMNMRIQGMEMNMVMLANANEPNKTILLNAESKTYSKMDVSEFSDNPMMKKMQEMQKDSLVVVGETETNGYHCTQVNVITTLNMSSGLANLAGGGETITEYWLTKDIPGYEKIQRLLKSQPKMLNGSNAEIYQYGIPVKYVIKEDGKVNMVMELKTAEQKDIPDSKFEIPDDYKEGQ